jgi:hypothetical protein
MVALVVVAAAILEAAAQRCLGAPKEQAAPARMEPMEARIRVVMVDLAVPLVLVVLPELTVAVPVAIMRQEQMKAAVAVAVAADSVAAGGEGGTLFASTGAGGGGGGGSGEATGINSVLTSGSGVNAGNNTDIDYSGSGRSWSVFSCRDCSWRGWKSGPSRHHLVMELSDERF